MTDDVELLKRYARESDENAFSELVRRHIDLVYAAALPRVGYDAHLAEDITQRVFNDLAQQAGSLAIRSSLAGWLYTRARFAAANLARAERRRRERELEAQSMIGQSATPQSASEPKGLRPVLDAAIDQLSPEDRDAILLRFYQRRPFAEIGRILGLSDDAAQKRVDRSLDRMRKFLVGRGVDSTSSAVALMLGERAATAAPVHLAAKIAGSALASAALLSRWETMLLQMTTTAKSTAPIAVVLLLAALGTATYEFGTSHKSQSELAAAQTNYQSLVSELHGLELLDQPIGQGPNRTQSGKSDSGMAGAEPVAKGEAFLARHPELQHLHDEAVNARLNLEYGALFKQLGLTSAQIGQFMSLVRREGQNPFYPANLDGNSILIPFAQPMSAAESDAAVETLLGADGYTKYLQYVQNHPGRAIASKVAENLAFTDTPLTPAQSDQLAKIVAQNSSAANGTFDWNAIVAGAAGELSPSQLSALTNIRTQYEHSATLNASLHAAEGAGNP
jgi:RNA polymerase sigma factor (sigma-70 family)